MANRSPKNLRLRDTRQFILERRSFGAIAGKVLQTEVILLLMSNLAGFIITNELEDDDLGGI